MGEKVKNKDAEKAMQQEDELETGLEDTFPASDPLSSVQPGDDGPESSGVEGDQKSKPAPRDK